MQHVVTPTSLISESPPRAFVDQATIAATMQTTPTSETSLIDSAEGTARAYMARLRRAQMDPWLKLWIATVEFQLCAWQATWRA